MDKENKVVSMAGNPIYRYTDGEKEWESPHGEENIESISAHIEKHVGKIDFVYHEILSDTVHIDVHCVKAKDQRPYHTLITSGMSDLPMTLPDGVEVNPFMELGILLPPNWKVDQKDFKDDQWFWPIGQLKFLARFPHKYDTWLGYGHTIPNGDPAEPYGENTLLNGVIILPFTQEAEEFHHLVLNDDKTIDFYCVVPLYEEEMNLKLRKGTDSLLDKFDKYGVGDVIDINRRNVAKKRFGLF